MISYDTYQNKIKRVAAVKNFIVRFRALFITLFALIFALLVAFLCTKGMITQDVIMPEKIVYGDSYYDSVQAPKALFCDADFQFARIGDTDRQSKSPVKKVLTEEGEDELVWSYEFPTLSGKYLVRTVTNRVFGSNYGEPRQFEIEAFSTEFKIKSDSIVYGELPDSYEIELISGDTLVLSGLKIDYANPELDVTEACANAHSFVILDKTGKDVTFCYDINLPKTEVSVIARDVLLTPQSQTFTYDGQAVDYRGVPDAASLERLKGDSAQLQVRIFDSSGAEIDGTPVNAGEYTVEAIPGGTKIFNGGISVLSCYNVTYSGAKITILPRKLHVTTKSASKIYDGEPLVEAEYEQSGLLEGHALLGEVTSERLPYVGTYSNGYSFTVTADGTDVTANYDISCTFGTLEIARRPITVTTADRSKIYDGTPLSDSVYEITGENASPLVSGHSSEIVSVSRITEVAASGAENEVVISITDGTRDLTENYAVNYVYGSLEITRREVLVTTPSDSWVYDGEEHSNSAVTIDESTPLADGEQITVVEAARVRYYSEAGEENAVVCKIYGDERDVSANYDIKYASFGTLKIEKRPLKITTPIISKVYDGKIIYGTEQDAIADNLVYGDELSNFEEVPTLIDCGKVENKFNIAITNADGAANENYQITYNYGYLEITKRDLTIYTPQIDRVYDGTAHMGDSEKAEADNLVDGEVLNPYEAASRTLAGETENTTKYKIYTDRYIDSSDNSITVETTANYNITYENRHIVVSRRPLTVDIIETSREYDGTPYTNRDKWELNAQTTLVEGHVLVVDESFAPTSVTNVAEGGVTNDIHFKVLFGDEDMSANYEITRNDAEIYVTGRILTLRTADGQWFYDNAPHSAAGVTPVRADESAPFVLDHKLQMSGSAVEILYVGERYNVNRYDIVDGNGNSQIDNGNYAVTYSDGKLVINPRPVTITTADGNRVYDDTPYTLVSAQAEPFDGQLNRGICSGHKIEIDTAKAVASVTYVTDGAVENVLEYLIFEGEKDVTSNYDIKYDYGEIYVTEREISLTTASSSAEFDGDPYFDTRYDITDGELLPYHILDAQTHANVTFVTEGSVENEVSYRIEKFGTDLTANYKINYTYGAISRTVRHVLVTTADNTWVYDSENHYDAGYEDKHALISEDGSISVQGENGLVLGHKLVDQEVKKVCDYTEQAVDNVVSYIVENEEINANYVLHVEYGKLAVDKRPIIIVTANASKVYDGDPFSYTDGWSTKGGTYNGGQLFSGLVGGHKLRALSDPAPASITNVGTTDNVVKYVVVDADGNDKVNVNYYIDDINGYEYGKLERTKRPIKITTADAQKEYDGTALTCSDFTVEQSNADNTRGLLENKGHTVKLLVNRGTITYITLKDGKEVSTAKNERLYKIMDGATEVTGNYGIDYDYGTLTILKKALKVTTATLNWQYDGNFHSEVEMGELGKPKLEGLIDGETFERITNTITKVRDYKDGGYPNETEYKFYAGSQETTHCYAVEYVEGVLSIGKIQLNIKTRSAERVYDGQELYCIEWDYCEGSGKLSDGHKLQVVSKTAILDVVYKDGAVAAVENAVTYKVVNASGSDSVNVNYTINCNYGTLKLTPRDIIITTPTAEHEYDGQAFSFTDEGWSVSGGVGLSFGLVSGHKLKALTDPAPASIINAGTVKNEVKYKVVDENDDDKVNANYNIIRYGLGTLTVLPRNIHVYTHTESFEYDGKVHSNKEWEKVLHCHTPDGVIVFDDDRFALVDGHRLKAVSFTEVKNVKLKEGGDPEKPEVCGVENEVIYKVVDAEGGDEVNANYKIFYVNGTLTVNWRTLEIALNDVGTDGKVVYGDEIIYPKVDGKDFTYLSEKRPVEGHEITVDIAYKDYSDNFFDPNPKDVGNYIVTIRGGEVKNHNDDEDVNGNYLVYVTQSYFSITKRELTIKLNDVNPDEKVYDGEAFVFDGGYTFTNSCSMAYEEELEIAVDFTKDGKTATPVDAGTYLIAFNEENSRVNGDTPSTKNYKITCENTLKYTVKKRELVPYVNDLEHAYCGTRYSFAPDDVLADAAKAQLVEGHNFDSITTYILPDNDSVGVNVGEYRYIIFTFTVCDAGGETVTANYTLTENRPEGKLNVTKRKISVSVDFKGNDSDSCEYTGQEIDLVQKYPPYGAYASAHSQEGLGYEEDWGIYDGDLAEITPEFTFEKNGAAASLKDLGEYSVSVDLTGEVIGNYDITEYTGGNYEITNRQIFVLAGNAPENLEYDGNALDTGLFSYYTRHNVNGEVSEEEGFIGSDGDNYQPEYTVYKLAGGARTRINTADILQAGEYEVEIALSHKDNGSSDDYFVRYDNFNLTFTVAKRGLYVTTPDDERTHVYNGEDVDYVAEYGGQYTVRYAWGEGAGFVNGDEAVATACYEYALYGLVCDSAKYAGEYTVKISRFEGVNGKIDLSENYEVKDMPSGDNYAELKISRAKVLVVPFGSDDRFTEYDEATNSVMEFPSAAFSPKLLYVEGSETISLFAGDSMSLSMREMTATATLPRPVTLISSVTVTNGEKDVTDSYDVAFTYADYIKLKKSVQDLPKLSTGDFMPNWGFKLKEVHIEQFAPETTEIEYGSANVRFALPAEWADGVVPASYIKYTDAYNSLPAGYKIKVAVMPITANGLKTVTKWLTVLAVYDGNGSVSQLFKVIIDEKAETNVHIVRSITVNVSRPETEFNEGDVIDGQYVSVTYGSLLNGAELQVTLSGGKFVAAVKNGENDVTEYYKITLTQTPKEAEYESRI